MKIVRLFPLSVLFLAGTFVASAVEPWADEKLPVKDGLAVWLDAVSELKALGREKGATVEPGIWHDASGFKRDARQEDAAAQPAFVTPYPTKVFSFDGKARHFVVKTGGLTLNEATVVVFARARSNPGGFRGLISAHGLGTNDYRTGFNIDLGANASEDELGEVNVEGAGFGGEKNLLKEQVRLGATFALATRMGLEEVQATIGAAPGPTRPRTKERLMHLDQLLIGARIYDNMGKPPTPRGFFEGARQPVDRLAPLSVIGARVEE